MAAVIAPSREDPVIAALSPVIGGPAGDYRRSGRHGWWTATRVLIVVVLAVLAVGVVQKQHCRAQGWTNPDQFFHACYSDLPLVYEISGLADGVVPYVDAGSEGYLDHPVVTGFALWAVGLVTPDGPDRARWYFDLATVVIGGLLVVLVVATVQSAGRRRPWDAALVAASPLVALAGLVSLDVLGVTLAAVGLALWGRNRPAAAGLLIGLATAARSYPVLFVVVLGLLAARAGRWRAWCTTASTAVGTAAAVVLPWGLLNGDGVLSAYRSWESSYPGYGSLWRVPQVLTADAGGWMRQLGLGITDVSPGVTTTLAIGGIGAALLVGALVTLTAPGRPRVAQVAFVVLAIVVVTGKSWPVQASLWLLPLAALARPRWRDHLIWTGGEIGYFVAVWLYLGGTSDTDRGLPGPWYVAFLMVRLAGLAWLVWCVVQDMRHPERDLVRRVEPEDPLAGPLAGSSDALVLRVR
ncbi:MAG: glycosyltransferase family 87 protein [Angustibacter sp.]